MSHFMHGLGASGHPQMRDSGVQGPMALDADEISAALTPEGLVESVVANGKCPWKPKFIRR